MSGNVPMRRRRESRTPTAIRRLCQVLMTMLAAVGAVSAAPCVNPGPGLVGWWRAEGNASDGFGVNHGTVQGGLGFSPGEVGSAFSFTGAGQGVTIPASSTLDVGPGAGLTMEAWIFPTETATQRPIFEYNNGGAFGAHFWINVTFAGFGGAGSLYATVQPNNTDMIVAVPGVVTAGTWQHVAFTYDRASGFERLYLNGTEVASRQIGNVFVQTALPLNVGVRPGSESFAGQLDEVSLYNRALSAAELQVIVRAGAGGKCPVSPLPGTTLLYEGFEGVFPANWSVGDADAGAGATYWTDVSAAFGGEGARFGGWKGYCAGSAYPFGSAEPNPAYPNSMQAYMQQGINFGGYSSAQVSFWYKIPSIESCCDRARLWFYAPFSGSFLLWQSASAQANWSFVTVDLPPVEPFGTLAFEFQTDVSVQAEGLYLDEIALTGYNAVSGESVTSLTLANPGGAILEVDASSAAPGRDREFIQIDSVVRSVNAFPTPVAYDLTLSYRLLDGNGAAVALYDSSGALSADSTSKVTNRVTLPARAVLDQTTRSALRPAAPLDAGAFYTIELSLLKDGVATGVRATNGPLQFFQFRNTVSGDAPLNVQGRVQPISLARDWAIRGSPSQAGFLVNATSVVARFDDFNLPASTANVPVMLDYQLLHSGTGQPVPLKNSRTVLSMSLPSHSGGTLPGAVLQTNAVALLIEPADGVQLDSVDARYEVRVSLSHTEGGTTVADNSSSVSSRRLYHFNGKLFFSAFETYFASLEASPVLVSVASGDHVAIAFRISPGAGRFPGAPQHSFGDGTARTGWLFVNGDTLVDNGTTFPVTGPVPDVSCIHGICFSRTNIVLYDNGPRAPVQLRFPPGFTMVGATDMRLAIGRLAFGLRTLNSALEPTERVLVFSAPIFGVEETKPFWIGAPRLEWCLNDGQIVLPNPSSLYFTRQTDDDLLEASRPLLTRADDADRISNDGYYRNARLGPGDVVIRADTNGAALMTANVILRPSQFRPHFPYTSRATAGHIPMTGGQVTIADDQIDPATSSVTVDGPVPVPYKRDCLETNCPASTIGTARLNFTADGNALAFTSDGGLLAYGAVPQTNLTWGYVDSPGGTPRFAQQAGPVTRGAFRMSGTFLRGNDTAQSNEVRAAVLLLTGAGDASNPAYRERPGDEPGYRLGFANYAGVNFRAPTSGRSFLAGQDTGPFPLTPNAKYYARFGGISGIHQAQSIPNSNLRLSGYDFTFRGYRLSYLDSEVWESLTEGRLTLPSPSQFFLDFEKMRFTCRGALESAALPAGTDEKKMEYWETWIQPLSLEFRPSALDLCDPAKRYLVLGVQTQLPLIPEAFQAALAFRTNGNLAVTADKVLGVDSRFPVPGQISLLGSGSSLYKISTAGDGYFNNPETPGAPAKGFFNIAGRLDLFWFEDSKVHLHVTPESRTVGHVDLMGGWRTLPGSGKDVGWTDGADNYFSVTKFDQTHRGFPARAGLTLDAYRNSPTENWRPRAQREWLELVTFDYPLEWDGGGQRFRSFEDSDVVLPVIDIKSRLKTLTPGKADIDFSQDINLGLPRLKLLDLANDAYNEINAPLNSLSNAIRAELTALVEKTGVNGGFRALQRTLRENADAVMRPVLEPTLGQAADRLCLVLSNALRTDAANFMRNVSNNVVGAGANLNAALAALNGASNDVNSVIGQVSGVLRDVDDTLQLFIEIVKKDPNTQKRNLVGKIVYKLANDQVGELGLALGSLTQDLATDLVGELDPTLDKIEKELVRVQSKLAEVRTQLGAGTGQFNAALGAVANNGNALGDFLKLASAGVSNLMFSVITPAGDYFTGDPARAQREVRERLIVAFLSAPMSAKYQQTFRNFLADDNFVINELMDTLFQQVNSSIRSGLQDRLTSARDGVFQGMKGPSFLTQTLLSAKVRGAPEFNGDSMRKIRLDADVQLNIPNEMKFSAFMQVLELDSASAPAGCIPPGGPAAEVTLGAMNVPLGWSGFDNGQTANIAARWNIQNKSVYGIGGKFELGGVTKVKGANISGFGAQFAVGSTEAFLAARAAGESKGIQGEVGFFAGKTCSMEPLKMIDPEMNQVLHGDPLAFRGIYVQYGGRFPLTQLVGIPPSCLLRADGWANNAIYYDWSVPPVGRLGGRQKVGLDVELLCVLGGNISWAIFASVSGNELMLGGQGEVCGKIGVCPFCVEGCAGLTVTGVLSDGGVSYDVDY